MLANKHPAYKEEANNLNKTCICIDNEIKYMSSEIERFDEELKSLKIAVGGNYDNDVFVKNTIITSMKRKLKELDRVKEKPYFGRIDFKELGKDEWETYYIGKTSLEDRSDNKRLIIDWRAPIASLYYSGEIGEVMYKAPDGLIIGDLEVKRQYEIEGRQLINIFDKGLTPMDEYLQNALWQKKDNRLRDIVTTIQSEQNDIIRADKDKVVIVQGVAGSGKTTIVLHRIAYLMYTYQEMFKADSILILVPNRLFLNYISDVLPDLGVEEITQSTFEDLAIKLINEDYSIRDTKDKLVRLIDYNSYEKEYREKLRFVSEFKGSLLFKEILDRYMDELLNSSIPKCDFKIGEYTIFTHEEIKHLFNTEYDYLPLIPRINRMRNYIEANIKDRVENTLKKIEEEFQNKVNKVKTDIEDEEIIRNELIRIYDQKDEEVDKVKKGIKKSINKYFSLWPNIDINIVYKRIIANKELIKKYSDVELKDDDLDFLKEYCEELFNRDQIEREDLPPLLYIHMKLVNASLKNKFNHIVIDEAQDYSQFQMYLLKELSSNYSFTIVGDLSQGIYSYKGIKDWKELMTEVFDDAEKSFLTLKKCYRSTMEIMNFANEIIKKCNRGNLTLAEPVLRSGDKPLIIGKDTESQVLEDIAGKIGLLKREGHKSIAIICKNEEDCSRVYKKLSDITSDKINLITDKDTVYNGGIVVIPTYFAKGLEFDAVMVYNCSNENYPLDELHTKLLYVAVTRPLHKLYVYFAGNPSPLIEDII
jgi:DNA helicase-2/ATP-dependent DNA helicase PcrA